jgi:Ca2+-binding RTX toxin-like protein
MKTIKIGNMSMVYTADDANTLYSLAEKKIIVSGDYGLDILGQVKNRDFEIDGTINAGVVAARIGLPEGYEASPVDFTIGKSGHLIGGTIGIASHGTGHVIRNEGMISAGTDGIRAYGNQTIVNSGEISGANGINLYAVASETAVVKNSGTITGSQWSIYGTPDGDRIINKGELNGDVQLSGGLDTFIHKGGHVDGVVRGGLGGDTYIVRAEGLNIVEVIDEGDDRVRASVDFALQANIEDLWLTGKADIDGTGNGGNNELYGNAGRNHLSAGFGFDILDGGTGNDVLEGGVGADQFQFLRGTGKDVVVDYEATFDDFYFVELKGASDFADMIEDHAEEKKGDVVITFGKDVIVIENHAIADLQESDFHFTV